MMPGCRLTCHMWGNYVCCPLLLLWELTVVAFSSALVHFAKSTTTHEVRVAKHPKQPASLATHGRSMGCSDFGECSHVVGHVGP
jgi:hypothetical protein